MEQIYIEGLPAKTRVGGVVKLLIEQGGVDREHIGNVDLDGGFATAEIADNSIQRAVKRLDGAQIDGRIIAVWKLRYGTTEPHFEKLLRWLAWEAEAELDRGREGTADYSLTRLTIRHEDMGLGGHTVLTLGPKHQSADLPYTRLSSGAPILLAEEQSEKPHIWRGVVTRVTRKTIAVAFDHPIDTYDGTFALTLSKDEVSRQRMERALSRVASARSNRIAELRDVLLGERPPEQLMATQPKFQERFLRQLHTEGLNASQISAITHALSVEHVAIIHGPPGTGKTTTLTRLIAAAVQRGDSVLACAPSNLAVDNLAAKLVEAGIDIVRVGHPVRVHAAVQPYALDLLVEAHPDYKRAKKIQKEAAGLSRDASKFRRAKPEKGAKRALRDEAKALFAEARQLEAEAIERVLDRAHVVLATLTGISSNLLGNRQFDLCVIDEAGQSTEPANWIPIKRSKRIVLAGDHQQLPPTILSKRAAENGFTISLLERLITSYPTMARRLDVQYRMHTQIMTFSSTEFYDKSLVAHESVSTQLLSDCASVETTDLTSTPVTFIDTAGASYDEELSEEGSRRNIQEAELVVKKVGDLMDAGVMAEKITVITPYSAQVRVLRELLPNAIEVNSVDGVQGRENEVIIVSLVRSNTEGSIGFLSESRRMNVAFSRARRKLIVIGDSGTVAGDAFFGRFIDYVESIDAYRSVWEDMS